MTDITDVRPSIAELQRAIAPCLKCGTPTDHRIEFTGLMDAAVFECESCFDGHLSEFLERQRQFQELIDAGMPRASANAVMIGRIDEAERIHAERNRS
jgi:hypothetical protein